MFKEPASFWVFSLGFGLTFLVTALLTPTLVADLYGVTHLGFISGFITTVHMFGGGLWTYLGGVMFDRSGNYDLALVVSAVHVGSGAHLYVLHPGEAAPAARGSTTCPMKMMAPVRVSRMR